MNPNSKIKTKAKAKTNSVPKRSQKAPTITKRKLRLKAPALPSDVVAVLLEVAQNTRKNAYVPYSTYKVGAALLGVTGNVFSGCNVENASYGLAICAERSAFVKAISEGERDFVAIAVVTDDGGTPCGACRQFMAEFGLETIVILANKKGAYTLHTVGSLLPNAFVLN